VHGVLATHAVSEPTVSFVRGTVQDEVENMCLMRGMEEDDEIPPPPNQQFRETEQELLQPPRGDINLYLPRIRHRVDINFTDNQLVDQLH